MGLHLHPARCKPYQLSSVQLLQLLLLRERAIGVAKQQAPCTLHLAHCTCAPHLANPTSSVQLLQLLLLRESAIGVAKTSTLHAAPCTLHPANPISSVQFSCFSSYDYEKAR